MCHPWRSIPLGGRNKISQIFCCAFFALQKKTLQEIHHITQSELSCQFNKHIQNLRQFRCKDLLISSKDIACCKLSDYLILMSLPIIIPFCSGLRGRSTRRIRFSEFRKITVQDKRLWRTLLYFCYATRRFICFTQLENSI